MYLGEHIGSPLRWMYVDAFGRADPALRLRRTQMPHNRLYLRLQEGVPTGIVVHAFQFIDQHRTTVYPSYEGLYCAVGRVGWLVEQGEFRLAVASWCKHF